MLTTNGTYPWSLVTQIFRSGKPSHSGGRKTDSSVWFVSNVIYFGDDVTFSAG